MVLSDKWNKELQTIYYLYYHHSFYVFSGTKTIPFNPSHYISSLFRWSYDSRGPIDG